MLGPAIATLFGIQGIRAGRNLYKTGKGLFRKLNPEAKPMKMKKPQAKQIKTAKPKMIKPKVNKIEVSPEEKEQIMGWYGVKGFKPGAGLKQKKNWDAPLQYKDVASGFGTGTGKTLVTKTGKQFDKKKQPLTVFDRAQAKKAMTDELEKATTLKLFR